MVKAEPVEKQWFERETLSCSRHTTRPAAARRRQGKNDKVQDSARRHEFTQPTSAANAHETGGGAGFSHKTYGVVLAKFGNIREGGAPPKPRLRGGDALASSSALQVALSRTLQQRMKKMRENENDQCGDQALNR